MEADQCDFGKLFANYVPHLLEKIFFSLDYKSYKTCLEVSIAWKELLTSKSYKMKEKSVFHKDILKDGFKLWEAASEGDEFEVVQILSHRVVDLNTVNQLKTPLGVAACNGHKDIVLLLVNNGAELNRTGKLGKSPLYHAANMGHVEIVRVLIGLGAESPLVEALLGGKTSIVQVLLEGGDNPNAIDFDGCTPLRYAVFRKDVDFIKLLLRRGAKPRMEGKFGNTPLHYAKSVDVVKLLLNEGAELNKTNICGQTSLFRAARAGNKDVVKLLIDSGADKDIADDEGMTPLACAQEKGYSDIVNILKAQ